MWSAIVDGRRLTFHLAGINNQNFIMRDDETGTWWQQVSGKAIAGPLAGRTLEPILADEVTFDVWKAEHPFTRVLRPDDGTPWQRFSEKWEEGTAKYPQPPGLAPDDTLEPRDLVIGVASGDASTAYPLARLTEAGVVLDTIGATPVAIAVGDDGTSVRVFDRRVDGTTLELYRDKTGSGAFLVDSGTKSQWDFSGRCTGGALAGKQLQRVPGLRDYWFDWRAYHPQTKVWGQ